MSRMTDPVTEVSAILDVLALHLKEQIHSLDILLDLGFLLENQVAAVVEALFTAFSW